MDEIPAVSTAWIVAGLLPLLNRKILHHLDDMEPAGRSGHHCGIGDITPAVRSFAHIGPASVSLTKPSPSSMEQPRLLRSL